MNQELTERQKRERREYRNRRWHEAKEQHICPICRKSDERTLAGYTLCKEHAGRSAQYYQTHKEYYIQYQRDLRAQAKAMHYCPVCKTMDERTKAGNTYCETCAAKYREYRKKQREEAKSKKEAEG